MVSMMGRGDLVTQEADTEYFVWWKDKLETLGVVSTATMAFKVGPVEISVLDADGNVVPPTPVIPEHHLGFRFYRLAQASDDLYDAYRNMYLAFESLLSSKYPKTQRLEIDWLRSSMASVAVDLSLESLAPTSTNPVDHILSIIYNGARLPLFHAKDGKAYFAPVQSASDREAVETALTMLTHIVIRMAAAWFSTRRAGGSVNLAIVEQHNKTLFRGSRFVLSDDPKFTLQEELEGNVIRNGASFPATFNDHWLGAAKQNISGQIAVANLAPERCFNAIYLVNSEATLINMSPDVVVDLNGFESFHVRFFLRSKNASEPRHMFPR